jgi:hypothetical protein
MTQLSAVAAHHSRLWVSSDLLSILDGITLNLADATRIQCIVPLYPYSKRVAPKDCN